MSGWSALNWAPSLNSGQGVPGSRMEPVNKGPAILKKLKKKRPRKVLMPKRRPYVAHPEPPIRTDEGAR